MKHNNVINIINMTSTSKLESSGISLIALLAPKTNNMLKIFDPITLPITN